LLCIVSRFSAISCRCWRYGWSSAAPAPCCASGMSPKSGPTGLSRRQPNGHTPLGVHPGQGRGLRHRAHRPERVPQPRRPSPERQGRMAPMRPRFPGRYHPQRRTRTGERCRALGRRRAPPRGRQLRFLDLSEERRLALAEGRTEPAAASIRRDPAHADHFSAFPGAPAQPVSRAALYPERSFWRFRAFRDTVDLLSCHALPAPDRFEVETLAFFLTTVGLSVAASSVPEDMAKQCA
jgi:hypothetical protein